MSEKEIVIDETNSIQILYQFIEVAQKGGSFLLQESAVINRCKDILFSKIEDKEISPLQARQAFIQAVVKGQAKGLYTLDESTLLHKVCMFISNNDSKQ